MVGKASTRTDRRRRACASGVAAAGLLAALSPLPAVADTPAPTPAPAAAPVSYTALVVDRTAPATAPLYAAGGRACPAGACPVLQRSDDGGHRWSTLPTTGWSGAVPSAISAGGRQLLVAPDPHGGVDVSSDGGVAFTRVGSTSLSQVDVGIDGSGHAVAVGATASGTAVVIALPSGAESTAPGTALKAVTMWFTAASPWSSATPALAAGNDSTSKLPYVDRCTAALACAQRSAPLSPQPDAARLYVSPHFTDDHLVMAATSKLLLRSTDGGASFAPVTVMSPPPPGLLVTAYPQLAFTPDFDAVRHRGHVYVAVIGVTGSNGHPGTTVGGVYASADGASWTHTAGSPLDHGATAVAVASGRNIIATYAYLPPHPPMETGILCSADGGASWAASCPAAGPGHTGGGGGSASGGGGGGAGGTGGGGAPAAGASSAAAATPPPAAGWAPAATASPHAVSSPARNLTLAVGALLVAVLLGAAAAVRRRQPRDGAQS